MLTKVKENSAIKNVVETVYSRLFLTPPAERTKTQVQNSRKKLNLWEDFPSHLQNSRKN